MVGPLYTYIPLDAKNDYDVIAEYPTILYESEIGVGKLLVLRYRT